MKLVFVYINYCMYVCAALQSAVVLHTHCWGWSSLCLLWRWASSHSASSTYKGTEPL